MSAPFFTYWRGLASGARNGILDRLLLIFLFPLSLVYSMVQCLRAALYRVGILKTMHLPRPVVSIGNITVGGTGKTPVSAWIARYLISQGHKVAVLSRGYGGTLEGKVAIVSDGSQIFLNAVECGDEPFLLAATVPGLMVVIGADRHAAGQFAMERLRPDLFLLDDGFQHIRLHRDLDILLLDCVRPFGNGLTLPAGLLREPISSSRRAGLIIHTRCSEGISSNQVVAGKPFCIARHHLNDALPLAGGEPVSLESLCGRSVVAFAGIAEPDSFFRSLTSRGLNVIHTRSFPDHVSYDAGQISGITATMEACGAEYAVTTEKDGVKLGHLSPELSQKILLARLDLTIDDPAPLTALLLNLLQK